MFLSMIEDFDDHSQAANVRSFEFLICTDGSARTKVYAMIAMARAMRPGIYGKGMSCCSGRVAHAPSFVYLLTAYMHMMMHVHAYPF